MKHWYRRGAAARLLWPASVAFGVVAAARRLAYRARLLPSAHPGIPVIVVGNLTVGGSGKTPLVLWIAEFLKARGWTPAIVSRGYGGRSDAPRAATLVSDAADVGDEPLVLARRSGCPVWVGRDRLRVIQALRERHEDVDVVVLDDGLQHYRLRRDVEVAVLDARGFGNGWLIPAGPLREPPRRLRSVDAVVTHQNAAMRGFAMSLEGEVLHCAADARQRRSLASFRGERVHAVAGIGDPNRFFLHLASAGVRVVPHAFPDHHRFVPRELEFADGSPVLMTEKDAVKLRGLGRAHWWVLPVTAKLDPAFGDWLLGKLHGWRRSKAA
jgi:tetraacyldisaccharide 4'-kinase